MSQEHEKHTPAGAATHVDEIKHEAAPFEPSYQPETLPQISVPDLADDAQGLSAEALANVPTLTEQVAASAAQPSAEDEVVPQITESPNAAQMTLTQEAPVQADTWGDELQVRMGKLNGDIETLNARLDRLEERNKTKV